MSKIKFELSRGSDVLRDGMFLELSVSETSPLRQIAEVFYSDVSHEFFLTCYEENIPLEAVEKLISEARISLPPVKQEQSTKHRPHINVCSSLSADVADQML